MPGRIPNLPPFAGPAPADIPPAGLPPAVSDEALLDLATDVEKERASLVAAAAPQPNKPYKLRTLGHLREGLNAIASEMEGAPKVEWEPSYESADLRRSGQWAAPLPPALFVPLVGFATAVDAINVEGEFEKYRIDPFEAAQDDSTLLVAAMKLKTAAKDKKFLEALRVGPEGAKPVAAPEETEETEEEVAERYLDTL